MVKRRGIKMSGPYSEIRFVMAENLPEKLKKEAKVDRGLVALKIRINSPPAYEVEPISGSPTDYLKKLAEEDGITQEDFDRASECRD